MALRPHKLSQPETITYDRRDFVAHLSSQSTMHPTALPASPGGAMPTTDHLVRAPVHPLATANRVHNSNSASLPTGGGLGGGNPSDLLNGQFGANTGRMQPNSVINLSNSSDVVIGPMTQYQGAVTIYQYMDATVDSATGGRGPLRLGGVNERDNTADTNFFARTPCKVWVMALVVIIGFGMLGLAGLYMTMQKIQGIAQNAEGTREPPETRFSNGYSSKTIPSLGNDHIIIDRKQWGASSPYASGPQLDHPIAHVIITHVGVQSKPCDNLYNCSIKMRTLQDAAIAEKNLTDLSSNFYVSNDGYIYVGRGWNVQNTYSSRSISVCFMGDYVRFEPSTQQLEGAAYLLEYGITSNYLDQSYLLVGLNQTKQTRSPGTNVYKQIVKWPHWYSGCGVDDKPLCSW